MPVSPSCVIKKGRDARTPRPPAWDGFRASPPVKGWILYPMEDLQRYRHTVGGRFIPSGYLSSQKPIHDPSCQTGDRAPQGRSDRQPGQAFCWSSFQSRLLYVPRRPPLQADSERRPRLPFSEQNHFIDHYPETQAASCFSTSLSQF